MKKAYIEKNFKPDTLKLIRSVDEILAEYQAQDFVLTLRQVHYQLVSRDITPNTQKDYDRLSRVVTDARRAGLLDWNAIIDRTRNLVSNSHWRTPADIMRSAFHSYREDLWKDQEFRPFVMIEKDALIGVIEKVCSTLDIPYLSCRGYMSDAEIYAQAQRCLSVKRFKQKPVILHLGDHDPSGIDMTRDITDRFKMFMGSIEVRRLALNINQVEEYNPPPNFAKETDSRYQGYFDLYGGDSWELDALKPTVIAELIQDAIEDLRDEDLWNAAVECQEESRKRLEFASDNWLEVESMIDGRMDQKDE